MKIAIIGASGKTGTKLLVEALDRHHEVVAVCRKPSVEKLHDLADSHQVTVVSAPIVSDQEMLTRALAGCHAVLAVPISAGRLKATDLVRSLSAASLDNGVNRFVFTAGEVTTGLAADETHTLRQHLMLPFYTFITWFTPYSLTDMRRATDLIRQQDSWVWTIIRAPTLTDSSPEGYAFCDISDVTINHTLSRSDYASCLLDSLDNPDHFQSTLTVISAKQ
ncbi:NAD(P)-dependent oxidoreductase [Verrucomicrobiota bacterium]